MPSPSSPTRTRTSQRPRFLTAVSCVLLLAMSPTVLARTSSSRGLYLHLSSEWGVHFDSVSRIGDRTEISHTHDCRECDPRGTEPLGAGSVGNPSIRNCDHGDGLAIFGSNDDWSARGCTGCSEDSPATHPADSDSPASSVESVSLLDSPARSPFVLHHPAHPQAAAVCLPLLSSVQFLI